MIEETQHRGRWRYECSKCGKIVVYARRKETSQILCGHQPKKAALKEWQKECKYRGKMITKIIRRVAGCGCSSEMIEVYECRHFNEPVLKQGQPPCLQTLAEQVPKATGRTCRECKVPMGTTAFPPQTLSAVHHLAFVTSYFNPQQSVARAKNLETFSRHIASLGIPLFVVQSNAGDAILWQKERMINRCIEHLPDDVDAVGWLDADVIFARTDIHDAILDSLARWPVLQLWSECVMLDALGGVQKWNGHNTIRSMAAINRGQPGDGHPKQKHPGFAWAARRDTLEAMGGLYDRHITGSGDTAMVLGFYGDFDSAFLKDDRMNPAMREHWLAWARVAYHVVQGRVGVLSGKINHLYHGEIADRQYMHRWQKLAAFQYNPARHVRHAANGSLEWTENAPRELVDYVSDYLLHQRKE